MEDDEDCKNKESVQGKGQKKLQFGDKTEEVGEENEGQISELASGLLEWWQLLQTWLQALGRYFQM